MTDDLTSKVARLEALVEMLDEAVTWELWENDPAKAGEFEALRTNDELAGVGYDANVAEDTGAGYFPTCHCRWIGRYSNVAEPCEVEARKHVASAHRRFIEEHPDLGRVVVWDRAGV